MCREAQILSQNVKIEKKKSLPNRARLVAGELAWRGAHNPVISQSLSTGPHSYANLQGATLRIM